MKGFVDAWYSPLWLTDHVQGGIVTVNNALKFGKYFRFILQGGGEGGGVAQFGHCKMLDYASTAHFLIMKIDFSQKKNYSAKWEKKNFYVINVIQCKSLAQ